MHSVLNILVLGAFFLLPVFLLWMRARWPKRMPWWAVVLVVVGVGWPLAFGGAVLNATPTADAPLVMALYFGWAYALCWFLPFLAGYGIIQLARRWWSGRNQQVEA